MKLPLTLNTNVTQWFQLPYFVHQAWHWTTKTRAVPRPCPCQATVYQFCHSQTWGLCLHFFILCVWVFCMPKEGIRLPETGVTGSFSVPVWVLGTEPRSSVRVVNTLNHWVISLKTFECRYRRRRLLGYSFVHSVKPICVLFQCWFCTAETWLQAGLRYS